MKSTCTAQALKSVVELGGREAFVRGDIMLPRGHCDRCHIVTEGLISVRFGKSAIEVDLIGPGELLNVGAILGAGSNEHFAIALTDCTTFSISAPALERLACEHPELDMWLQQYVQRRLIQSMRAAECHLSHPVEQRLACWIAVATETTEQVEVSVTHQDLSTALGVRRPTITLALQQLEEHRAIWSRRGRIVVRSRTHLVLRACACLAARREYRKALLGQRLNCALSLSQPAGNAPG